MIFFTLDLDTPEEKARFQIDEHTHTASWDFYCECYSYTIRKIIATGLSQDYALNCRAKPLLFLIRHYIELCIKRNLNHNIGFATTHNLITLLELLPNQGYVPNGFTSIATELNYDGKGECFRYDKDHNGHLFFNGCHTINLANILRDFLALQGNAVFLIDSLCEEFPINNITNWDLTFHLHEASTLGQIRTQYDHVIEYIVKGVESEEYDLNKGEKAIKELSINYDQISKMGGEYIFSSHILPSNTKISLLNKFTDTKDTTIVYKIDNKHND